MDQRAAGPAAIVADAPLSVLASGFEFCEGPVWLAGDRELVISDIPADRMYRISTTGSVRLFRAPSRKANGSALDTQGRLVTCEHATSRVVRSELDGTLRTLADTYGGRALNSPNDVVVASDGTIYFTDPLYGRGARYGVERRAELPWQGVYRLSPDESRLELLADDFEGPNGLCLSLDERHLFVNDTERRHIRRFEPDSTGVTGGNVWAEIHGDGIGVPDGMKVDAAGRLFCTGPGGVHVLDEHARLLGVIRVPEDPANFTWGGDDRQTLFICATTTVYQIRTVVPGPDTTAGAKSGSIRR
ncbi:SMP-30/gluconolactonase/LRE family protein [Cellulomonas fimi]|uniref:SMP-30/gluconolactonase/LRE family protein n=1 Tax=Cellulomonas fimi TaxID=1708 RepID=UPI001B85C603|nr:SMP-30/gluconolactonase/LRE family protein [Cellulomonas fimi]